MGDCVDNIDEPSSYLDEKNDHLNSPNQKRDIHKKKDLPYRKQYCTFEGCNAYFFVRWHLDRHLRKHLGEKPYICSQDNCEKAFTCRSYLNKHYKQVHETVKQLRVRKIYSCSECDHVFKQKYNLKVHMCQHTGEKPFKCDKCDKTFTSATRLRAHTRTHNGYKCNRENCQFVADKWTELQKHVAQEHKEILECSLCKKRFNERYALTTHSKIHTGERLMCTYENCEKSYTNRRNLKTHIRINHEGQKFECDYEDCAKIFRYKSSLSKHIEKMHKTSQTSRSIKKSIIYTHRVAYAQKLTDIECCEQDLKKILLDDKIYRMEIATN